jgi:hypothetical protein
MWLSILCLKMRCCDMFHFIPFAQYSFDCSRYLGVYIWILGFFFIILWNVWLVVMAQIWMSPKMVMSWRLHPSWWIHHWEVTGSWGLWPQLWINTLMDLWFDSIVNKNEVFLIPACIKEVGYWRHFLGCCLLSQAPLCLILFFLKTMKWAVLVHQPLCNDVLPDHRTETMVPAIYGL